ncbi:unnamed protein product [Euphydryas editha]|uniref:CARD domain-containing protein n=1 Tax=Euphydryas editha TaxID=104508 RepID=A0AAU9TGE0_EUPED|nr:unnamed protein product [Euphydryas editha]
MDIKNQKLLQHHQHAIVKDLDVMYILDELFTKNVISTEDFDHIFNLRDREDRTKYLLKVIKNSNNNTFEEFVDSLAKDYNWLWKKLATGNNKEMIEDSYEDSLSRGDVPRLPEHFVRRTNLEQNILMELRKMSRHKILGLHGMSGCGKTCLLISVLRNNSQLITSDFNGVVYWLNFSNCKTEDDIIAQQNKLYRKALLISSHNSYMNSSISMSSIGSNSDSLCSYEWTSQELKDRLKSIFAEQSLKDALLVLDEVNETKCIEAFDIGCKIVVTTRDSGVLTNFHPQIIKIENYFSEEESLTLFASCLQISVSELPRQARKLHEICKGSPFHIALLGAELAENKERLVHDTRHWNYYLNKLEKKEFIFNLTRPNVDPMKTIEVCINSLKPNILPLFKMLTILPDNVKLTTKVLSKLWNKEKEVKSIIKQLVSKSLIMESFDMDQVDYLYEIHDLIMGYLRSCANEDELIKLHEDFLNSYNYTNVNDAPVEIEDDGYIAFYIGYHLVNTKNLNNKWSLFNRLYLDLKFLGNKARLTGPADVILDLQKYENHIANVEHDKMLLYSIKEYLSTYGIDLYRYPCTDIIQNILQNESKGILYTKAWQIAQERCANNELYFEFMHEQNVEEIRHSTIDVNETITAVCFLGDYVLVGTVTGSIKFFHIGTNKLKKELFCTGSPIKWVGACPANPPFVAALAYDGVVKLWYIDDVEHDSAGGIIEEEGDESLNNNYTNNETIAPKLGPFINCRWANNEETLITHTSKTIVLFSTKGKVLYLLDNLYRERDILCCVPSNCDKYVIVATSNSNHTLEIIDVKTKEKRIYEETDTVLDIVTVPCSNRVLTLKKKEVKEYEFKTLRRFIQNTNYCVCKTVVMNNIVKESVTFLSMAVNKTGTLLFVSTDDSRIICVNLKTNTYLFDLENRRGNVVSMSTSEVAWDELQPGTDALLSGTAGPEHAAKVWYLDAAYGALHAPRDAAGKVRLTTKFDASFINTFSPQTPNLTTANSAPPSSNNTPKRHQSFVSHKEVKKVVKSTMSLDRYSLKPLNLKGISNGNNDGASQPLLAVVDEKNNIQVMRGRKLITEILSNSDDQITRIKISPCNQHIIYGFTSGIVRKFTLRNKENKDIMDVNSPVKYMNFVNHDLMMVAGKNRCLMAYRLMADGQWKPKMLQRGNTNLGSQEILNDINGFKKKSNQSDKISSSGSDTSLSSKDRHFPNSDINERLCKGSRLVDCYWINNHGLITIESNATIKLWDLDLNLASVLSGRQADVCIYCSAFQKNVLVLCDDYNLAIQIFELKVEEQVVLEAIQESKLNNRIYSCALTEDGNMLALGLDSGDVVIWNVHSRRQVKLLKHHKSKVQWCRFSPAPARPRADDEPPLVLVSMATEIVWWDVSAAVRARAGAFLRSGLNVITPLASPIDVSRNDTQASDNSSTNASNNFFFGDNLLNPQLSWKANWRNKTFKENSKRKEILACIKLSGMNAKHICLDENFSCFVTVDNPGHVHIMKLMSSRST